MKKCRVFFTTFLAMLMVMMGTVAFVACRNGVEPNPPEQTSDLGPYRMTDANGTIWTLIIEDNYDFILQGSKTVSGTRIPSRS